MLAFEKDACNMDALFFGPCLQRDMLAVCAVLETLLHLCECIYMCVCVCMGDLLTVLLRPFVVIIVV